MSILQKLERMITCKQAQDNVIADLPPLEAQPGSATFPAPALVSDNYTFNYAALASHSLILENGARLVSPNFMPVVCQITVLRLRLANWKVLKLFIQQQPCPLVLNLTHHENCNL